MLDQGDGRGPKASLQILCRKAAFFTPDLMQTQFLLGERHLDHCFSKVHARMVAGYLPAGFRAFGPPYVALLTVCGGIVVVLFLIGVPIDGTRQDLLSAGLLHRLTLNPKLRCSCLSKCAELP
jgi:hypothetical protein